MNIFKLASIFIKLSATEDELFDSFKDDRGLLEHFLSIDDTVDNSIAEWAMDRVNEGKEIFQIEEAISYYKSNKGEFNGPISRYSLSDILDRSYLSKIPKAELENKEFHEENTIEISPQDTKAAVKSFNDFIVNFYDFISNNDIKIIPTSEEFDELGSGAYGIVFDVIYMGKRAAMKVSRPGEEGGYKIIANTIDSFPKEIAKHFPKIYFADTVIEKNKNGDNHAAGIVILEYLTPIPQQLQISGWDDIDKYDIEKIEYYINNFMKEDIIEYFNKDGVTTQIDPSAVADIIINELKSPLKDKFSDGWRSSYFNFRSAIYEILPEHFGDKLNYHDLHDNIFNKLYVYMSPIPKSSESLDYGIYNKKYISDSKILSLYNAIEWIHNNTNIEIFDMHQGNIMYRKSDDSLVMTDLGELKEVYR